MTAETHEGCRGCKHITHNAGGWCYMFATVPENLPCAQHDCFDLERSVEEELNRKYPVLTGLRLVGGITQHLKIYGKTKRNRTRRGTNS